MEWVLEHFERGKVEYAEDLFLLPCINMGWMKLNKYYGLTNKSPAYVSAVVLDPAQKWSYFEEQWRESHPKWIGIWKEKVDEFWRDMYTPKTMPITSPSSSQESTPTSKKGPINTYIEHLKQKRKARQHLDELVHYLSTPSINQNENHDPCKWWLKEAQQLQYPNLSKMALDILSIPAMSAEPERVFSGSKITISNRRCSLGIQLIEALECLKSWMGIAEWMEETIIVDGPVLSTGTGIFF
jgi:hypothetical protein